MGAPQSRAVRASSPNPMRTECTSVLRDKSIKGLVLIKSDFRGQKFQTPDNFAFRSNILKRV